MEPERQLCLIFGLGCLAINHVLVELFTAKRELVATLFECFVHPHQVREESSLLPQVSAEHAKREATEPCDEFSARFLRQRREGRNCPEEPNCGGGTPKRSGSEPGSIPSFASSCLEGAEPSTGLDARPSVV